jgi:large subunit ribosomal protein L25
MEKIILEAQKREVIGKKTKALRRQGKLPAVIYGYGLEATPIVLDMHDASRTLASVGSSTLVTIQLEGKEHSALVRERQKDVLRRTLLHVDFQALSLTETVQTSVRIQFGEDASPAVEEFGALLLAALEELEIECLPQDLPEHIEVDVSSLINIGDSILVKDLVPPPGVQLLDDPETLIIVATAPQAEPVEEELEEELGEEAEPEVIERGRQEDED